MTRSTKFLGAGVFFLMAFAVGVEAFHIVGMDFGLSALCGTAAAGVAGAVRLISA